MQQTKTTGRCNLVVRARPVITVATSVHYTELINDRDETRDIGIFISSDYIARTICVFLLAKVSERNNQLVLILNSVILLAEDASVRVASAQLEELDYRKLYEAYFFRGRKRSPTRECHSRKWHMDTSTISIPHANWKKFANTV